MLMQMRAVLPNLILAELASYTLSLTWVELSEEREGQANFYFIVSNKSHFFIVQETQKVSHCSVVQQI